MKKPKSQFLLGQNYALMHPSYHILGAWYSVLGAQCSMHLLGDCGEGVSRSAGLLCSCPTPHAGERRSGCSPESTLPEFHFGYAVPARAICRVPASTHLVSHPHPQKLHIRGLGMDATAWAAPLFCQWWVEARKSAVLVCTSRPALEKSFSLAPKYTTRMTEHDAETSVPLRVPAFTREE